MLVGNKRGEGAMCEVAKFFISDKGTPRTGDAAFVMSCGCS